MATFFMFGKYTPEAIKGISAERTQWAVDVIENNGGEVITSYILLGNHDLVFIVNFPGLADAIQASVTLTKLTGITISTSPALTVEEFDELTSDL